MLSSLLTRDVEEAEYVVVLGWNGPQDKPVYQGLLVSASLRDAVRGSAFVKVVVIARDELARVWDVLLGNATRTHGPYAGQGPEYYAEVWRAGQVSSFSLYADARTVALLRNIANALTPSNRRELEDVVGRPAVA